MPPEREYKFVTVWKTDAPLDKVWNEIYHSERWPEWWRGVEEVVELRKGDELGVGSIRRYTWKSALPYRLSFESETVRVEPMALLEGIASGELDGRGVWKLHSEGGHTTVVYDWRVRTSKAWMNFMAPRRAYIQMESRRRDGLGRKGPRTAPRRGGNRRARIIRRCPETFQ